MTMRKTLSLLMLSSSVLTGSAAAQADAWQNKWYWGAQAGLIAFKVPFNSSQLSNPSARGWTTALTVGGHWLITGRKSALYFAYDQVLFDQPNGTPDTAAVVDPSSTTGIRDVSFTSGRRIQAYVYIMPMDGWIQPYLGGGFSIQQVTDAIPAGTFLTASSVEAVARTIDATATKAFPVFTGGLQLRFGRLALFGHYQFMPASSTFLVASSQHVFSTGFRYAVTGSHEEITTER
jgi:opacity protein-like surface antigen